MARADSKQISYPVKKRSSWDFVDRLGVCSVHSSAGLEKGSPLVPHPGKVWLMFDVLKGNVYRSVQKSVAACSKKDSITASNCGRFLPALQIKSLLTSFALECFLSPLNKQ